jgi:hypothetical protein
MVGDLKNPHQIWNLQSTAVEFVGFSLDGEIDDIFSEI